MFWIQNSVMCDAEDMMLKKIHNRHIIFNVLVHAHFLVIKNFQSQSPLSTLCTKLYYEKMELFLKIKDSVKVESSFLSNTNVLVVLQNQKT